MEMQWQPPSEPPAPGPGPATRKPWLPAAIIGSAIVIAAGLIGGAVILKGNSGGSADGTPTTCQAWTETRQILQAVPALPQGWTWNTPEIDRYISMQNAPVGKVLDLFERKIAADPVDVAQAAKDYVAARRHQMQTLTDHTYTAGDGVSVDVALIRLDQLCEVQVSTQST